MNRVPFLSTREILSEGRVVQKIFHPRRAGRLDG